MPVIFTTPVWLDGADRYEYQQRPIRGVFPELPPDTPGKDLSGFLDPLNIINRLARDFDLHGPSTDRWNWFVTGFQKV
jgi:hypothetical protein